jgi:hypothetical protein
MGLKLLVSKIHRASQLRPASVLAHQTRLNQSHMHVTQIQRQTWTFVQIKAAAVRTLSISWHARVCWARRVWCRKWKKAEIILAVKHSWKERWLASYDNMSHCISTLVSRVVLLWRQNILFLLSIRIHLPCQTLQLRSHDGEVFSLWSPDCGEFFRRKSLWSQSSMSAICLSECLTSTQSWSFRSSELRSHRTQSCYHNRRRFISWRQ